MGNQWELYNQGCIGGAMGWGTNETCVIRVALGDQWEEYGQDYIGGAWVLIGGPMRWDIDELGGQWDGEPMRWGTIGIGRWWGDEWKGGPMRWGTIDMGDQWDGGPMSSNNVLGDQWVWGPMRWGTSERIPEFQANTAHVLLAHVQSCCLRSSSSKWFLSL